MKVYDKSARDGLELRKNAVPIIEVNREIEMDDLLKIEGHLYTVCIKAPKAIGKFLGLFIKKQYKNK